MNPLVGFLKSFVLWSTAFAHIISAHHTVPLLRSTPTYEPRPVLARPLLRPFSTTAAIVAFPLLLVATLASAIYYDSDGIVALHSSIQRTSQLFDHASDEKPTTTPTRTILGPDSYALMQQEMADGWKSALRGTASAVKASALVVLVLTLCAVETRAYLRYWQLSKVSFPPFFLSSALFCLSMAKHNRRYSMLTLDVCG